MFTGLVEERGEIRKWESSGKAVRFAVRAPLVSSDASIGDSICNSGCCLTVVQRDGDLLTFDAGEETLSRTTLGKKSIGDHINLERSLKAGDRLGGHFVTGHVDCVGRLFERKDDGPWSFLWFEIPEPYGKHLASKGSICVDGVSLTLVEVNRGVFSVALIPHTLEVTTLGDLRLGDSVNVETDLLAKYVERQLESKL